MKSDRYEKFRNLKNQLQETTNFLKSQNQTLTKWKAKLGLESSKNTSRKTLENFE